MTEQQSLLGAIIMNPAEDIPRLMYADYLQNSDDELDRSLGHYIKLSVELHDHKKPSGDTRLYERYRKGVELDPQINNYWKRQYTHPDRAYISVANFPFEVERGFISSISCIASQFLSMCDRLIWHESMTCACKECTYIMPSECPYCRGSKIRSRPCPLTAHPVREIEVTQASITHPVMGKLIQSQILDWRDKLAPQYGIEFNVLDE